jgi:prepilin-type processing-associated H-X9-DG protein
VAKQIAVRESEIRSPSNLIAVGDGFLALKNARLPNGQAYQDAGGLLMQSEILERNLYAESSFFSETINPREAARRHRKRLNMAFADGHVESGIIASWFFTKSDESVRRWNIDNEPHPEHWQNLP